MLYDVKRWLSQCGLYPFVRDVYRALSPSHRLERRLRRDFFLQLVRPGDLCFDIGANVGQSTEAFLACGASVVALEPNPLCLPALRHQFGGERRVTIIIKAVGSTPGVARLHFSGTAATASLRKDWNNTDDQIVATEVVTLGQLILSHGAPQLLKVDVEGFEIEVFKGLDRPVPIIYFEMHAKEAGAVSGILTRLAELGTVEGINAVSEDHSTWLLERWVPADEFLIALSPLPDVANVVVRMHVATVLSSSVRGC
jgi:FkbM family methyltransferase